MNRGKQTGAGVATTPRPPSAACRYPLETLKQGLVRSSPRGLSGCVLRSDLRPRRRRLARRVFHDEVNKELVSDELWRIVEPLLPTDRGKPGSKRHVTKSVGVQEFIVLLHQPPLWC